MPKIKVRARKLSDVKVGHISLVGRGANMIPFRIIKSEDKGMLEFNFLKMFQKEDAAPAGPQIAGLAIVKGVDVDAFRALLLDMGMPEPLEAAEVDGATVLKYDTDMEGAKSVKLSDGVVALIKGFETWPDSKSFTENVQKSGFFPGVRMATESFMETLYNIAYAEGTDTIMEISKAADEYSKYVTGLANAIPVTAIKMEKMEVPMLSTEEPVAKKEDDKVAGASAGGKPIVKADGEVGDEAGAVAGGAEDAGDGITKGDTDTAGADAGTDAGGEPVVKSEGLSAELKAGISLMLTEVMSDVTTAIDGLSTKVTGIETTQAEVTKSTDALKTQMDATAELAKSADEAVSGKVHTGAGELDGTNVQAQKTEEKEGIFDSALNFEIA